MAGDVRGGGGGGRGPNAEAAEAGAARAIARFADLARENVGRPRRAQVEEGLRQLSARLEAPRSRRPLVGGILTAVAVGVGAWLFLQQDLGRRTTVEPSMSYRVAGGVALEGGYLRETGSAPMTLAFSEGSHVTFHPGGRGRVRSVGPAGARLSLEHGTAEVTLSERTREAWQLDVGPFVVKAVSAAMTVSWDIAAERFELKLRRGHLEVSGPIVGDLALEGGHRLRVDLGRGETLIDELARDRPTAEESNDSARPRPLPHAAGVPGSRHQPKPRLVAVDAPATLAPALSPSLSPPAPAAAALSSASPSPGPASSWWWAEALPKGKVDEILADAARRGRAALEESPTDDLFALADAARYRRRLSLARDALMAARRRFPSSPRSLDAAYLLGRVEEAAAGGAAAALGWYDAYLRVAPAGTYASEALGRKMILVRDTQGPIPARELADLYLRRFPSGSYRGAAEALQRAP